MNLSSAISDFSPITLKEMDGVKLMSRTDTKFAFRINQLEPLLNRMQAFYKVLEVNKKRVQDYNSLYFDTKDRKFYIDHHNSRVNRNKVRFREYVGSELTFLEIKLKNNKGKTIKKRVQVPKISNKLSEEQKSFVEQMIGGKLEVSAKQWISFSRITFVHKKQKERVVVCHDHLVKKFKV